MPWIKFGEKYGNVVGFCFIEDEQVADFLQKYNSEWQTAHVVELPDRAWTVHELENVTKGVVKREENLAQQKMYQKRLLDLLKGDLSEQNI